MGLCGDAGFFTISYFAWLSAQVRWRPGQVDVRSRCSLA